MAAAQKLTGTHQNQDINPWDAYAAEMIEKLDPNMEAAIAAYAEHMYEEDATSAQNKEELARQREINQEVAKEYQWLTPDEYADVEARVGIPMNHAELISLLRKAGIQCYYRAHVHPDKVSLLVVDKQGQFDNACWATYGYMPELSMMNFDHHGAPLAERRRGWRTVLLQLILKGYLTEEKANKVFGKPDVTPQYHRYNSILQSFRNAGSSLGEAVD